MRRPESITWEGAVLEDELSAGCQIKTAEDAQLKLQLSNGNTFYLKRECIFTIYELFQDENGSMPAEPYDRAQARIWMDYCDTRYLPAAHRLMAERDKADRLKDNREKLAEVMRFMEHEGLRKLGDGPFWLGTTPSLVDFHFLPFFERFAVYEELAGAAWPTDCTRLRNCFEALSERRSYIATRHTLDYHLEQKRHLAALRAAQMNRG